MHIGSITKIFTTTLVMQLVDDGKVALDRPVIEFMPDFRVADPEATRTITVGELLDHSSGIDANLLPDVGHDKETIENTVTRMRSAPQLHAPEKARSYCNAGMVIAGYLCQQLRAKSWYDLVKERIFAPLDMKQAVVLPEDAVLYRLSVGHFLNPATKSPVRTPLAYLPIGYSPAGSTAMMSASDLMTFGRMHMAKGAGPNGARILSEASSTRMREAFGHVSGPQAFDSAIGWERSPGGLLHHGGGGPGIVSMLVTHPASQTAIVVLTNADYGASVLADLMKPFLKTRLGLDTFAPAPKALANQTIDPAPYVGIYENSSVVHEIATKDGRLTWTAYGRASYDRGARTERLPTKELAAAGDGRFLTSDTTYIKFVDPDASGKSRYLQQDLWLYRRT
jgi:CubicO group peptidase (beta-lactamase class C family)